MKSFALYTLARLGLFLLAFALIWLIVNPFVEWTTRTALWVAALAALVSAIASLLLLGRLRNRLAASLQTRTNDIREAVERSRRAEDTD